jgi:hypothetical protein
VVVAAAVAQPPAASRACDDQQSRPNESCCCGPRSCGTCAVRRLGSAPGAGAAHRRRSGAEDVESRFRRAGGLSSRFIQAVFAFHFRRWPPDSRRCVAGAGPGVDAFDIVAQPKMSSM